MPTGLVARRRGVTLAVNLVGLILILAGWGWHASSGTREAAATRAAMTQQLSELWEQLHTLEQENQALKHTIAALKEKLKALAGPRLNWPVYDVFPQTFIPRASGRTPVNQIELPESVSGFSLILNPETRAHYPDYYLEIIDPNGHIIWHGPGLQRSRLETFHVTLTRELLSAGRYTVRVYGKSGMRLRSLEEYPLVITSY